MIVDIAFGKPTTIIYEESLNCNVERTFNYTLATISRTRLKGYF